MREILATPLPLNSDTTLEIADGVTPIRRTVFRSGVRVLTQYVASSPSVALAAYIPMGSRDEAAGHEGSTHYLEHLLFKGTKTRSTVELARAFDRLGGEVNATTAKEYTNYYAVVLRDDLPTACSLILDMVTSPLLTEDDFAVERGVILSELRLAQDDPTDVLGERFLEAVLGEESTLAKPTGGTIASVEATTVDMVREHHRRHYRPNRLVVIAAGNVDHDELVRMVEDNLVAGGWDLSAGEVAGHTERTNPLGQVRTERLEITMPIEMAHITTGFQAPASGDATIPCLSMLTMILGGSTSSRLFQEVRDKRGLAYTTYAHRYGYSDAGVLSLYAGCAADRVDEVEECMIAQLQALAEDGPTPTELDDGYHQLRASYALGLDDNRARVSRLAGAELVRHSYVRVDDYLAGIETITRDDVIAMARRFLDAPRATVVVGPGQMADSRASTPTAG